MSDYFLVRRKGEEFGDWQLKSEFGLRLFNLSFLTSATALIVILNNNGYECYKIGNTVRVQGIPYSRAQVIKLAHDAFVEAKEMDPDLFDPNPHSGTRSLKFKSFDQALKWLDRQYYTIEPDIYPY